jgi:hypothetical protein
LDPDDLLPDAAIRVDHETNQYELHVSKVRRRSDGERWVDFASMSLVTEPLVVPIGIRRTWPEPHDVPASVATDA